MKKFRWKQDYKHAYHMLKQTTVKSSAGSTWSTVQEYYHWILNLSTNLKISTLYAHFNQNSHTPKNINFQHFPIFFHVIKPENVVLFCCLGFYFNKSNMKSTSVSATIKHKPLKALCWERKTYSFVFLNRIQNWYKSCTMNPCTHTLVAKTVFALICNLHAI